MHPSDSTSPLPRHPLDALVAVISYGTVLDDADLEAMVECLPTDSTRKALLTGLYSHGFITSEQLSFAIAYRWPLKGA